ncbi:MAG: hypothetical protein AABZ06_04915 [Bdellovibrionota bacterium]
MRIFLLLGICGMLLNSGSVMANEDGIWHFNCHYATSAKKGADNCHAVARVCRLLIAPLAADAVNPAENECRDALAVQCNGQTVFADGATHTTYNGLQVIAGIPSVVNPTPPSISYTSEPPVGYHFFRSSWLKLDSTILTGFCEIQKHHDRGDLLTDTSEQ